MKALGKNAVGDQREMHHSPKENLMGIKMWLAVVSEKEWMSMMSKPREPHERRHLREGTPP